VPAEDQDHEKHCCELARTKRVTGSFLGLTIVSWAGFIFRCVMRGVESVCVQYAAIPWRRRHGAIEILLITTRTSGRWIVPKGWSIPGLGPSDCAAHEAAEEAGVVGNMDSTPLGSFHYEKRLKSGEPIRCKVETFAMEVLRQRRNWPEKGERETHWCSPEEAIARVSAPGLRRLIARLAKSAHAEELGLEAAPTR
jgi:8-oxo-dGTP pyrophosphatase MutT (NUDIX family)